MVELEMYNMTTMQLCHNGGAHERSNRPSRPDFLAGAANANHAALPSDQ